MTASSFAYTLGSIIGSIIPWICIIYIMWYFMKQKKLYNKIIGIVALIVLMNVSGLFSIIIALILLFTKKKQPENIDSKD